MIIFVMCSKGSNGTSENGHYLSTPLCERNHLCGENVTVERITDSRVSKGESPGDDDEASRRGLRSMNFDILSEYSHDKATVNSIL
uniref:Uncharacterized protein n=1 Tax=Romanomermis culicivorax TaxID=13658 RepID=A0A915K157_ROMCU